MGYKIDLHVHSRYSGDNDADPEEAVLAAIKLGLHGIAFTEHYWYAASEHAERLSELYGRLITVLRGVEFSTEQGHCLIFGADTDRMDIRNAPVQDIVRIAGETGGVVIPSHPYRGGNSLGDSVHKVEGFCAIEGYNGCNLHTFNLRAIEAAGVLGLPYTGGSDAHAPVEVGSCYTEFTETITPDNFISLLKKGKYHGVDTRKISRGYPFPG